MSGICGWVGRQNPSILDAMLEAIDYRGDRVDRAIGDAVAIGYRFWEGRPGKAQQIHRLGADMVACAGTFAPPVTDPAAELSQKLERDPENLDGAFAGALWNGARRELRLVRDPFGVRSLYYTRVDGVFYFASELKQLLAIPSLKVELDPIAIHKYLTFSFVAGEDVPIAGIKRLLPGRVATLRDGQLEIRPYFRLEESIDPRLEVKKEAVRMVRTLTREAVAKRLNGEKDVALFLSGGLDSSGVAAWLTREKVRVRAFSLDFGERSVEKDQAVEVARHLQLDHRMLPVSGEDVETIFADLVWKLDLPFGDAVTAPQYLLGKAARGEGLAVVFSGEGGDQLFGGWTNKPMVAAEIYGDLYGPDTRAEQYLESYHRFYGLEDALYAVDFHRAVGTPGQRRAHLIPYLEADNASTFLNRIRLADIHLKGSQNILPRAERMANAWALDARVPLFDRKLAEASFRLPPQMKLKGACEKYVLKLALQKALPREIVWRKKYGMSVPITEWTLGPLASLMEKLLGWESTQRRGLFRPDYIAGLRAGRNEPNETRRRRVGERIWTLAMLEGWMRVFIDGRGRRPGSGS